MWPGSWSRVLLGTPKLRKFAAGARVFYRDVMNAIPGRIVAEAAAADLPGRLRHPEWGDRWPWLVQGITARAAGDLGLFTRSPSVEVQDRWSALLAETGMATAAHARQVHEAGVRVRRAGSPGLHLAPPADGHATRDPDVLLGVTVADCTPVYLVAPDVRVVGLLHAGWRGAARGILEVGVRVLAERFDVPARTLHLHLGPAICGDCYEVGPEVHEQLGLAVPERPEPVDLRAVLARRAVAVGIPAEAITRSALCTRCGGGVLFSHRAGDAERQLAYLGVRA